jgi:hypothetical protein
VLLALGERGLLVGRDDDGRSMSVDRGRGREAWLAYGTIMRFEADAGRDSAFSAELNALLATLQDEYAPVRWLSAGSRMPIWRGNWSVSPSRLRRTSSRSRRACATSLQSSP